MLLVALPVLAQFGPSTNSTFTVATNTPDSTWFVVNFGGSTNRNLSGTNLLPFINAITTDPFATTNQLNSATNTLRIALDNAYAAADTVVSNSLTAKLGATNTAITSAYGAADTVVSNGLSARLIATNDYLLTLIGIASGLTNNSSYAWTNNAGFYGNLVGGTNINGTNIVVGTIPSDRLASTTGQGPTVVLSTNATLVNPTNVGTTTADVVYGNSFRRVSGGAGITTASSGVYMSLNSENQQLAVLAGFKYLLHGGAEFGFAAAAPGSGILDSYFTRASAGNILVNTNLLLRGSITPTNGVTTVNGGMTNLSGQPISSAGGYLGAGGALTLDASGFNGNLTTSDNTVQEVAQKFDDLSVGSGGTNYGGIVSNAVAALTIDTWYTNSTPHWLQVVSTISLDQSGGDASCYFEVDIDPDGTVDWGRRVINTAPSVATSVNVEFSGMVPPGGAFRYSDVSISGTVTVDSTVIGSGGGEYGTGGGSQLIYHTVGLDITALDLGTLVTNTPAAGDLIQFTSATTAKATNSLDLTSLTATNVYSQTQSNGVAFFDSTGLLVATNITGSNSIVAGSISADRLASTTGSGTTVVLSNAPNVNALTNAGNLQSGSLNLTGSGYVAGDLTLLASSQLIMRPGVSISSPGATRTLILGDRLELGVDNSYKISGYDNVSVGVEFNGSITTSAGITNLSTAPFAGNGSALTNLPGVYEFALSDESTAITTGTKLTWRAPFAMTITGVRASLTLDSSGGIPTVDIHESGTTIFSTKLTIDAGEKTSTTAAAAAVISDTAIADDAEITFDVDVAGTGAAGLKVRIYYRR